MKPVLFFVGFAVAAAAGFALFIYMDPIAPMLGMSEAQSDVPLRISVGFGATLVGVVLGAIYRELRKRQASGATNIDVAAFFRDMRGSIELWLGLVGSPVVFALLLRSTEGMDLFGLVLVALENGFCCLIILNAFIGRREAEAAA